MPTLVLVIGVLVSLIGLVGVVVPERLVALVTAWQGPSRFWGAVIIRLILGVVFIIAAPDCRWPLVIKWIGYISIAAALALPVIGVKRLDAFIEWWTARPGSLVRASAVFTLAFGLLVVYAAG